MTETDSSVPRTESIVGFEAHGRYGALGTVVDIECDAERPHTLVIRGGVSKALLFLVPCARVRAVSARTRTVILDVDLGDFDSSLLPDGTVELRAPPRARGGEPVLNDG